MKRLFLSSLSLVILIGTLLPGVAAAHPGRYEATVLNAPTEPVRLAPGATATLTVRFKNTGDHFWNNRGRHYASLYTWNPQYRASAFQHPRWMNRRQIGVILEGRIDPGKTGSIEVPLKAPQTPGTYREEFHLAAEDLRWIPGGKVIIPILVTNEPAAEPTAIAPRALAPGTALYQAEIIERPQADIKLRGGAEGWVRVTFRNTGKGTWTEQTIKTAPLPEVGIASASEVSLRHFSWDSENAVMHVLREVPVGGTVSYQFPFKAPPVRGSYQVRFTLVASGASVAGSDFELPVTVTDDAPSNDESGGLLQISPAAPAPAGLTAEPIVRIGLYTADGPVTAVFDQPARLELSDATVITPLVPAGTMVTLAFNPGSNVYTVQVAGGPVLTATQSVRFVPLSPGIVTISNYSNPPKWNISLNDNVFRGALEIRRASTGYTWIINELPMEQYLDGLAETSNRSHSEYHKAIIVAARTYAYYHLTNPYKHAKGGFTVDAYWDQVYRGYKSELRMNRFVASVAETRGEVVTHGGTLVVTPYFARSDGRTRGRHEVWGGAPVPWLQSVPTPHDAGERLLGHGVGMSATEAAAMAIEGKTYREILPYFYTGTELKKLW